MKDGKHRFRSGSEPTVKSIFTRELCDFFDQMILPADNWPGIKSNDLIDGIVDAVIHASKKLPDGMGIALLQTLAYGALDAVERSENIVDEPSLQLLIPPRPRAAIATPALDDPDSRESSGTSPAKASAPMNVDTHLSSTSPLFAMGYTVAEGILQERERQEILKQAISASNLPALENIEDRKKWGRSDSVKRIQAVAEHIFWLATFQGQDKPGARKRWLADLAWIQDYYSNLGKKIDWTRFDASHLHLVSRKRTPNEAFMKALTPSKELAAILGDEPMSRVEVTKRIWDYIKIHKLQDTVNRRMINADRKLLKIFNKKQVSMFEMTKLINVHLR